MIFLTTNCTKLFRVQQEQLLKTTTTTTTNLIRMKTTLIQPSGGGIPHTRLCIFYVMSVAGDAPVCRLNISEV